MKKIIFLVSLCLASSNALAIVGGGDTSTCADQTTQDACTGFSNLCWWQITSQTTGAGSCKTCPNALSSVANGSSKYLDVSITTFFTLTAHPLYTWSFEEYNYCPWLMTCPAGRVPYIVPPHTGGGFNVYSFTCNLCEGDSFRTEDLSMLIVKADTGYLISSTTHTASTSSSTYGDVISCTACGANSHANANHTGCNCDNHYQFSIWGDEDYSDDEGELNNDTEDCYAEEYWFYLHPTGTDTSDDYVTYTYRGNFTYNENTGASVQLSTPGTVPTKRFFAGWFSGTDGTGQQYFANNIASGNPIDQCDNDDVCQYDANRIHLYAKYSWKNYTLKYDADGDGVADKTVKTCTYNSDCTAPESPDASHYPAGKAFARWKLNGQSVAGGASIKSIETAMTSEFTDGVALLTAEFTSCPAGYYCPAGNTSKQPCPVGTTSDTGADDKTDCYVSEDTIFKDNNGEYQIPMNKVKVK